MAFLIALSFVADAASVNELPGEMVVGPETDIHLQVLLIWQYPPLLLEVASCRSSLMGTQWRHNGMVW